MKAEKQESAKHVEPAKRVEPAKHVDPAKRVESETTDIKAREASEKGAPVLKSAEKKIEMPEEQQAPQARKAAGTESTQPGRNVMRDTESQSHA